MQAWVFVLLMAAYATPVMAAEDCPPNEGVRLKIERVFDEPRLDTSKTLPQLQAIDNAHASISDQGNSGHPVGLAQVNMVIGKNYEIASRTSLLGQKSCGRLHSLTLRLGFKDNTIFVANELQRGTCIYDEVMRHEHSHMVTDRAWLDTYISHLQQILPTRLNALGPVRAASQDSLQQQIETKLDAIITPLIKDFRLKRDLRQAQIDTTAEYERVNRACNGEMHRLFTARYGHNWRQKIWR